MKQSCNRAFTKGNEPVGDFIWTFSLSRICNPCFGKLTQSGVISIFNFQFSIFN